MTERIAIINLSYGYGDLIYSTPTVRKIREFYPKAQIDLYTHVPEVFERNPYVNEVRTVQQWANHGGYTKGFVPFDLKVATQRGFCTSTISLIDMQALLALNRTLPERDHWCDLCWWDHGRGKVELPSEYIVLHANKTWPTRTFPEGVFYETLDCLSVEMPVVVVGKTASNLGTSHNPQVFDLSRYRGDPRVLNYVDQLTLHQTAEICHSASVVVTTDSGLLPIACCTKAKVISIHTCVDPFYRRQWRGGDNGGMTYKWYPMWTPSCDCYDSADVNMNIYNCPKNNFRCFPTAEQILDHVAGVLNTKQNHFQYEWSL